MRLRKSSAAVLSAIALVLALVLAGLPGMGGPAAVLAQPAPSITSVTPNSGLMNSTMSVTINGSSLSNTTAVDFGSGITVDSFAVTSNTTIAADITIAPKAGAGPRDVTVTTLYGADKCVGCFTVEPVIGALKNVRTELEFRGSTTQLVNTISEEIRCGKLRVTKTYNTTETYAKWFKYEMWNGTEWVLYEYNQGVQIVDLGNVTTPAVVVDGNTPSFVGQRGALENHQNVVQSAWYVIGSEVERDGEGYCRLVTYEERVITTEKWQTYKVCTGTFWDPRRGPSTFTDVKEHRTVYGEWYPCPSPGGGGATGG